MKIQNIHDITLRFLFNCMLTNTPIVIVIDSNFVPHIVYSLYKNEVCMVDIRLNNNLNAPKDKIHIQEYDLYDMEILESMHN
ncbi:hypothetical protein V1478_002869 [Vespula squamosa]|uniref:Uncharacterized protein n=1 Tax=Vespula squamosa TaxID=30214 RepID=A0ABD2BR21_VESSQ